MERIKSFNEFVNETFLEKPADANLLNHNKKKMKKNGYVEATVIEPVDGLEKDDKVLVSATEFGQLDDESLVTCYKDDKEIITAKKNLQVCV
jgi:hypothetical protein